MRDQVRVEPMPFRWQPAHRRQDHPATVVFYSELECLDALRKFYDWEASKNVYPEKVSELVARRPMLRLLRR